jgi:hypothetical protein
MVQGLYSAVNARWNIQILKNYITHGVILSEVQYKCIIEINKRTNNNQNEKCSGVYYWLNQ